MSLTNFRAAAAAAAAAGGRRRLARNCFTEKNVFRMQGKAPRVRESARRSLASLAATAAARHTATVPSAA